MLSVKSDVAEKFMNKYFKETIKTKDDILTEEKWDKMLKKKKELSAPGLDGINYVLLKI